ncbi:phage major capsid protein [Lentilactobacillus kefiri]|uniref:phage major capsid protein n=2 Tax=Lactobacillales TaxID=186826 RepID=UPI000BA63986|nr:phage major capsid protein [Lentilactobacillus kefiri]PAK82471.1 hypothetical protein B8W85_08190 [Lentilactobacillus kefiri]
MLLKKDLQDKASESLKRANEALDKDNQEDYEKYTKEAKDFMERAKTAPETEPKTEPNEDKNKNKGTEDESIRRDLNFLKAKIKRYEENRPLDMRGMTKVARAVLKDVSQKDMDIFKRSMKNVLDFYDSSLKQDANGQGVIFRSGITNTTTPGTYIPVSVEEAIMNAKQYSPIYPLTNYHELPSTVQAGKLPIYDINNFKGVLQPTQGVANPDDVQQAAYKLVDYSMKSYTMRMIFTIQMEKYADNIYNFGTQVAQAFAMGIRNTLDEQVMNVLKTLSTQEVISSNDITGTLQKMFFEDLKPQDQKNATILLSQTANYLLQTQKDANGSFYMDPNIANVASAQFNGRPIVVVNDQAFGSDQAGKANAIVGDLSRAVATFVGDQIVGSQYDNFSAFSFNYGALLTADVEKVFDDAAVFASDNLTKSKK